MRVSTSTTIEATGVWEIIDAARAGAAHDWRLAGVGYVGGGGSPSRWEIYAPTWLTVAVLLAPVVLLTAQRLGRGGRVADGLCPSCG